MAAALLRCRRPDRRAAETGGPVGPREGPNDRTADGDAGAPLCELRPLRS